MPAEPAPGQAAYEAHAAMVVPRPWRWDQLDGKLRAAWAAADAAVAGPLNAENARLREEAASLRGQLATTQAIARAMQATGIEILGRFRQSGSAYTATASASPEQLAKWRSVLGGEEAMAEYAALRDQLAEVRRIAYQGGQDAASVRQELLAYLEANGAREALKGGGDDD